MKNLDLSKKSGQSASNDERSSNSTNSPSPFQKPPAKKEANIFKFQQAVGHNVFSKNRADGGNEQKQRQLVRPAADFMTDEALSEVVRCATCDEEFIKAFIADHVCSKQALDAPNQAVGSAVASD